MRDLLGRSALITPKSPNPTAPDPIQSKIKVIDGSNMRDLSEDGPGL